MYFAGAEAHCPRLYDNGVRRMLASFHYIDEKKGQRGYQYMDDMFTKYGKKLAWFMDSGAFTLQQKGTATDKEADEFLDRYIYALKNWKPFLTDAVELDLDSWMGMGWVEWARERIINETGITPILVHHPETRTYADFVRECAKYPYVGFSIGDATLFEGSAFHRYYDVARRTKTKLHAFGITQPAILMRFHFYSCDSFSWSMGAKFGTTFQNDQGNIRRFNNYQKEVRRTLIPSVQRFGIQGIDFLNDKYKAIDKWNIQAWIMCEQDINKRFTKPYWPDFRRHHCNQLAEKTGLQGKFIPMMNGPDYNPVRTPLMSKKREVNIRAFKSKTQKFQGVYNERTGTFH